MRTAGTLSSHACKESLIAHCLIYTMLTMQFCIPAEGFAENTLVLCMQA